MKIQTEVMVPSLLVQAVQAAVLTMALGAMVPAAFAGEDDDAVNALVKPTSSVEVGAEHIDHSSAKFGEYNGLNKEGTKAIGNVDIRGGGDNDQGSTTRYRLIGRDLGTDVKSLDGEYGQQGSFRFGLGYDELQRNRSDTYQTPYQGVGGNLLTLPPNWILPSVPVVGSGFNARGLSSAVTSAPALVSGVVKNPTAGNLSTAATLQANDLPMFHKVDLYTRRATESANFSALLTPQWDFTASIKHEHKTGMKPMGALSILAPTNDEVSTVIPDPIQQTHNQYNAAVTWHDGKSSVNLAYYGSTFQNDVKSVSWTDWSAPTSGLATISSAPDNQFHQFNLTGTHNYSADTRLVAGASLGRTTQNQAFLVDGATTPTYLSPAGVSSLNGEVISRAFNLKLTTRVNKDLSLAGAWKFDQRDNRTPVNTYLYSDDQQTPGAPSVKLVTGVNAAGTTASTVTWTPFGSAVGLQNANANRPYSKRQNQFNLDADYRLNPSQAIKAGYEYQVTDRYCNGSWIDCVDADKVKDNTLKLEWRSNLLEDVSGRVGYAYSMRRVNFYNENAFLALVPYANVLPTGGVTVAGTTYKPTMSAYQYLQSSGYNGYGPAAGLPSPLGIGSNAWFYNNANNALTNAAYASQNRISELPGMRRYNMADRNRDKLRAALDWQASTAFSVQGSFEYNNDDYFNSTYGLKQGSGWALNLDGTWSPSETFSATVYWSTEEQRQQIAGNSYTANSPVSKIASFTAVSGSSCYTTLGQRNASNKVDPCLNWTNDMRDTLDTVGLAFQQKGLLHEKLELGGDLNFSRAHTTNNAVGGNYVNNPLAVTGAAAGTVAAFYIPATDLPVVATTTLQLRLNGQYHIDKASAVRLGVGFSRMRSNDYVYAGMQPGGLTAVLPSYEQAPVYTVHTVAASYIYSFQ